MKCLLIEDGIIPGFNFHPVTHTGGYYLFIETQTQHSHTQTHTLTQTQYTKAFQCREGNAQAELGCQRMRWFACVYSDEASHQPLQMPAD